VSPDREAALAFLEAEQYGKVAETVHLKETTMQKIRKDRRKYKLKKIVLVEQERLEAAKRKLNEEKVLANKDSINARNQQLSEIATEHAPIGQSTNQQRIVQRTDENLLESM
jgi:hypothetical protein